MRQLCKSITICFDCQVLFIFVFATIPSQATLIVYHTRFRLSRSFFFCFRTLQLNAVRKTTCIKYHKFFHLSRSFSSFSNRSNFNKISYRFVFVKYFLFWNSPIQCGSQNNFVHFLTASSPIQCDLRVSCVIIARLSPKVNYYFLFL